MGPKLPFSRSILGSQAWIQNDFPKFARMALIHLLHDLIDRQYVRNWVDIDREVRRIARDIPTVYDRDNEEACDAARRSAEKLLMDIPWAKVFDFCTRLHSHLATQVEEWNGFADTVEVRISLDEVQQYISDELERILLEEDLGFTFIHGEVRRRGRSHTRRQLARVQTALGDQRLNEARKHYAKAVRYFENSLEPDYENAVKEAVCAVEAAARRLFPETKAKTLGKVIPQISGPAEGQLPKPLAGTITGLYAYRNAGDGVSHGGADGGQVTRGIAEYVLALAASQVILLQEVASEAEGAVADVPF